MIHALSLVAAQLSTSAAEATAVFSAPEHVGSQVSTGIMVSYILYVLKKAPWFKFLTDDMSAKVQATWGAVAATLTAAGVHLATTGSFLDGAGFSITVTGLSANVIRDIAFQWMSQQGWYDFVLRQRDNANKALDEAVKLRAALEALAAKS